MSELSSDGSDFFSKFNCMKIFLFLILISNACFGQDNKVIRGFIQDEQCETVVFAEAIAYKIEGDERKISGGATTDIDGNFQIKGLGAFVYDVEISFAFSDAIEIKGVDLTGCNMVNLGTIHLLEREMEIVVGVPIISK